MSWTKAVKVYRTVQVSFGVCSVCEAVPEVPSEVSLERPDGEIGGEISRAVREAPKTCWVHLKPPTNWVTLENESFCPDCWTALKKATGRVPVKEAAP